MLNQILNDKLRHIKRAKLQNNINVVAEKAVASSENVSPKFYQSLKSVASKNGIALIAEIKRNSPSEGLLKQDFNAVNHAMCYQNAGATCVSVLTDEPYFWGRNQHIIDIRNSDCQLPIIRKDFIIDEYQVYESVLLGANAILLIMECLSQTKAKQLYDLAISLNLDVLVELHSLNYLDQAMSLNPKLLGVNSRNLKTLAIDPDIILTVKAKLKGEQPLLVAESGISSHEDIKLYQQHGINTFLVGSSLMKQPDLEKATRSLLGLDF